KHASHLGLPREAIEAPLETGGALLELFGRVPERAELRARDQQVFFLERVFDQAFEEPPARVGAERRDASRGADEPMRGDVADAARERFLEIVEERVQRGGRRRRGFGCHDAEKEKATAGWPFVGLATGSVHLLDAREGPAGRAVNGLREVPDLLESLGRA